MVPGLILKLINVFAVIFPAYWKRHGTKGRTLLGSVLRDRHSYAAYRWRIRVPAKDPPRRFPEGLLVFAIIFGRI